MPAFRSARTIALYAAFREEADPAALELAASENGARVAYPRVDGGELSFAIAESRALVLLPDARWEIREPLPTSPPVALDVIDLFVVPGIGFSGNGDRLGYGLGYYDRALRKARASKRARPPVVVGFAFACQVVDALPSTPEDERMDFVVTDRKVIEPVRKPRP
jgi:5-formyltetrahydrofolate cyclo-ligase